MTGVQTCALPISTRLGVRAVNVVGDGIPATVSTRLAPMPKAPGSLRAIRADRVVALRWEKPANAERADVTGYVVRTYSGGALLATRHLGEDTRSYRRTRLTNGKHYAFRVGAVSGRFAGDSNRVWVR